MDPSSVEIGGFSFSHRNTTLEERDMLAFSADEIARAIPAFRARAGGEVGILSTCNRTEFYLSGPAAYDPWGRARSFLAEIKGVRSSTLPRPAQMSAREAAAHLFRVASSLESVALGEDQILAQVKAAHELILGGPDKSPVLDQLFRMAVRTGKQVRTETTLCRGNVSISSVSVELAKKIFGEVRGATVALIGAGETGAQAATHFRGAGARDFVVVNRGEERGRQVAEQFGGEYMPLHRLSDACVRADIAVFATAAARPLVDREAARNIMRARRNRQLFVLDISNPRNVDPGVEQIDGVYLYNIDHLQQIVAENMKERVDQIPLAERIIGQHLVRWDGWLRERNIAPTIGAISTHYMGVRQDELELWRNKVSAQEFERLEEFSRKLVRKLQHNSIMFLKRESARGTLKAEDLQRALAMHLPSDDDES